MKFCKKVLRFVARWAVAPFGLAYIFIYRIFWNTGYLEIDGGWQLIWPCPCGENCCGGHPAGTWVRYNRVWMKAE